MKMSARGINGTYLTGENQSQAILVCKFGTARKYMYIVLKAKKSAF